MKSAQVARADRVAPAEVEETGRPQAAVARRLPRSANGKNWMQAGPLALLLLFGLVAPMVVMLYLSLLKTSIFGIEYTLTLSSYEKFFSESVYLQLLLKSLRIATLVTGIVLVISYVVGFWLAKLATRGKTVLLLLLLAPYWVNYVIRTYAWMPLLGRQGLVNGFLMWTGIIHEPLDILLFNEFSVQLVLIYIYLPFAIIPIYLSIDRIDDNLLRASADLGATPLATFRNIVLPLSAPGLASAGLTVFVLAVGAFVTPQLVGGPSGIMFSNVIADQFKVTFNWAWGSALSTVLVISTLIVVCIVALKIPLRQIFIRT